MYDAAVIGAGHNGLVAANLLADAGWDVLVLDAAAQPGGSVQSAELTLPGFRHDVFSSFYPMGAASPVFRRLGLDRYGLEWVHAPTVLAHLHPKGDAAIVARDVERTAASVDTFAAGDGRAWLRIYERWQRVGDAVLSALFDRFPPVRAGLRLATRLEPRELVRFARFALLPVRRMGEEEFRGDGGRLLLAGNAMHADIPPEAPGSGFLGYLLCCLAQQVGFPAPRGGAGELTAALVRRLTDRGGRLVCDAPVDGVEVSGRRAVAVRTSGGDVIRVRRAVIGALDAVTLYRKVIGTDQLPPTLVSDLDRFQLDPATFKVDWALDGPVPWTAEAARSAGTVHMADSVDDMTMASAQLACGVIPATPFLLIGQMTTTDQTRSPQGTETLWAYTHVPHEVRGDAAGTITGAWTTGETEEFADRIEARIEAHAPGFRNLIRGRYIQSPAQMEARNPSLIKGALNAGTAQLHQQLVFRPTPGLARPTTPLTNVFLGSASAHPGGGVHGAPGANAAVLALRRDAVRRFTSLPSAARRSQPAV